MGRLLGALFSEEPHRCDTMGLFSLQDERAIFAASKMNSWGCSTERTARMGWR